MNLFSFDRQKKEVEHKEIRLVSDCARRCLSMEEFKYYREYYAQAEQAIINELIEASIAAYQDGDLQKFGGKCLVKLTRLRDLRSLLTRVQADAKRVPEEKKEKDGQ